MNMMSSVFRFCSVYTVGTIAINACVAYAFILLFPDTVSYKEYLCVTFVTTFNMIIIIWLFWLLNNNFEKFVSVFLLTIPLRLTLYGLFIYYMLSTNNVHYVKLIGAFLVSYLVIQVLEIGFFVQSKKSRTT